MKWTIKQLDAFDLVGLTKRVTINHQGVNEEIKAMNEKITPEFIESLLSIANMEPNGIVNGSLNFENRHLDGIGKMDRVIGVAVKDGANLDFDVTRVPSSEWAVFEFEGIFPVALQEAWKYIKGEWLESENYTIDSDIELTRHLVKAVPGEPYQGEVWLSVKSK